MNGMQLGKYNSVSAAFRASNEHCRHLLNLIIACQTQLNNVQEECILMIHL